MNQKETAAPCPVPPPIPPHHREATARVTRSDTAKLTPLDLCTFHAVPRADGRWVGKCNEYPKLSTRPMRGKLDALDAIISLVANRIRDLDLQQQDSPPGERL